MSPASLMIIAFLLALIAAAFAFMGGAVVVAVPLAAIGIVIVAVLDFRRRREQAGSLSHRRQQAGADQVDFTERDKETLSSE